MKSFIQNIYRPYEKGRKNSLTKSREGNGFLGPCRQFMVYFSACWKYKVTRCFILFMIVALTSKQNSLFSLMICLNFSFADSDSRKYNSKSFGSICWKSLDVPFGNLQIFLMAYSETLKIFVCTTLYSPPPYSWYFMRPLFGVPRFHDIWLSRFQTNVCDCTGNQWVTCFQESGESLLNTTADVIGRLKDSVCILFTESYAGLDSIELIASNNEIGKALVELCFEFKHVMKRPRSDAVLFASLSSKYHFLTTTNFNWLSLYYYFWLLWIVFRI